MGNDNYEAVEDGGGSRAAAAEGEGKTNGAFEETDSSTESSGSGPRKISVSKNWLIIGTGLVLIAAAAGIGGALALKGYFSGSSDASNAQAAATGTALPTASLAMSSTTPVPSSSPTLAPSTRLPTAAPATSDPTASPTPAPSTATPTVSHRPTPSVPTTPSPTPSPTTALPTRAPTYVPTRVPTSNPTPVPTSQPTTLTPTTLKPTISAAPTPFNRIKTFSFYVMGDIAYKQGEKDLLRQQIREIRDAVETGKDDNPLFMVHVGDIFTTARDYSMLCPKAEYEAIANIFVEESPLPTYVMPGDNDWTDCPNATQAWEYWSDSFLPFEETWTGVSSLPATTQRQLIRPENFAFEISDVLLLSLNLIGGRRTDDNAAEWDQRIAECHVWAETKVDEYLAAGKRMRALIIFGHARRGREIFKMLEDKLSRRQIPTVYLHGNGHTWYVDKPYTPDWRHYWEVQVDQGANAPPIKVTVRGEGIRDLATNFTAENRDQYMLGDIVRADRRGRTYSWVNARYIDAPPDY